MIRRFYGTVNIQEFHNRHQLLPWPKSKDPSPQEIFHLSDQDFNLSPKQFNSRIKPIYNKYLKIYHPDICYNYEITNEQGKLMSNDIKRSRFDDIQQAYDILKDPYRRAAYGKSITISWEDHQRNASSFESYRMANAHRRQYDFKNDEQFWKAATWEDYYKMKYNRKPPTKQEFEKNKVKILIGVLVVMVISTIIQVMLALDKSARQQREIQLQNLRLLKELPNNYDLQGETPSRFSSIRRFLLHRRSTMGDQQQLRQAEIDDNALLTDLAQREINRIQKDQT